ncbi:macro domain-containing protein [Scytonema sp. PRP1]|uniref:macro domain-containing protein n=1 Tax=Scytonema sp. PRP1 TaxID=3120513 RepID=UPI00300D7BEC
MAINIYLKLLRKVGFQRIWNSFIGNFGLLWLLLEPAALFLPEKLNFDWAGYFGLGSISLILAIIQRFPKRSFCSKLSSPDSEIEVKIGDIFDEKAHLVIGVNDVFDTELGEIIKPESVQGQFLTKVYRSDIRLLDKEIESALQPLSHLRQEERNKTRGKTGRYPIGTTTALGTHDKRYFLTAYGYMNNNLTVESNSDYIWRSLSSLWREVRLKGHTMNVAIPIIGSDLARTGLPRMALAKLIITSFIVASKEKFVTRKLTVMVYPKDLDTVDLYELEEFLTSACF